MRITNLRRVELIRPGKNEGGAMIRNFSKETASTVVLQADPISFWKAHLHATNNITPAFNIQINKCLLLDFKRHSIPPCNFRVFAQGTFLEQHDHALNLTCVQ